MIEHAHDIALDFEVAVKIGDHDEPGLFFIVRSKGGGHIAGTTSGGVSIATKAGAATTGPTAAAGIGADVATSAKSFQAGG